MPLIRSSSIVLLAVTFAIAGDAQTNKSFPTDDEINLVLIQTERAIQQYKPLIDQEQQIGPSATDAIAKDRQVVQALELAVKTFKGQPQGFNGPLGFAFFQWLDDATRNSLLCGANALTEATGQMVAGKLDKVDRLIRLSRSCSEASTLIYTVSENAGALYQRYVAGISELAEQATDTAQKLMEAMKKNSAAPKK